jgi:serine/threonine protein phosphatase PrpC
MEMEQKIDREKSLDTMFEVAKKIRAAKRVLFTNETGPLVQPLVGYKALQRIKPNALVVVGPKVLSGVESLQGKRKTMEDTFTAIEDVNSLNPELDKKIRRAYFGVYDGHSGTDAAIHTREHLHKKIIEDPAFLEGDYVKAIENGIKNTDQLLLELSQQSGWKNGTTVVLLLIIGETLYVANLGDSEAVIAKRNPDSLVLDVVELSRKHKPGDAQERKRIEDLGGSVYNGRLFGTLAVSRALGDSDYKLPLSKQNFVSAEPYIGSYNLTDSDEFCIVACDGLWDKFTYQDAANFVLSSLQSGNDARQTAALIAREAIDRGSMDNVTVIIILLRWNEY